MDAAAIAEVATRSTIRFVEAKSQAQSDLQALLRAGERLDSERTAFLPDPVARAYFLSDAGDLESAMLRLGPSDKKPKGGLSSDLEAVVEAMKSIPWTTLQEMTGEPEILEKIDDAETMLCPLRKALS